MRLFWMVLRYRDDALQAHPHHPDRNIYYMSDVGRRGEINGTLFPSLESAEAEAIRLAQANPTETIVVLEQKSIFELPELPRPIKKRLNAHGELVPDA